MTRVECAAMINKHCINWRCSQKPELMHTGNSPDKPQWWCCVCKSEYYVDKEGSLTKDRPFKWPTTKNKTENYEIKNGHWKKV